MTADVSLSGSTMMKRGCSLGSPGVLSGGGALQQHQLPQKRLVTLWLAVVVDKGEGTSQSCLTKRASLLTFPGYREGSVGIFSCTYTHLCIHTHNTCNQYTPSMCVCVCVCVCGVTNCTAHTYVFSTSV